MLELRSNQVKSVEIGTSYFKDKKPPPSIMVLPTAAGKSIIIAQICKNVEEKILILQPSKELLEQNYAKFTLLGGEASIYSASLNTKEIGHVTYATIGSIKNIGHKFSGYKLIIDECDRFPRESSGMLRTFIKASKITHVLGLTATPLKLQTNTDINGNTYSRLMMLTSRNKTGIFFKRIIYVSQIKEMVENGFWSPLVYESYDVNDSDLRYNTTKADFTQESLDKMYEEEDIDTKIINWIKNSNRKSILVAVPSVAAALCLANKIPNSAAVWGDMDKKERKRVIDGFKNLTIRVVIQVNVLSVGFDHPELDAIVCGRPTASLSWWYQFVGRITRIHPSKKDGLVVDFVGNTKKFGKIEELLFVEEDSVWKLYGEGGKLLTGIPMHEIGVHTLETEEKSRKKVTGPIIMPYGKYKGKEVKDISPDYRNWMLQNFDWNKHNNHIKQEIIRLKNP